MMINNIKKIIDRKEFHIAIIGTIIVIIVFVAILIMLKYNEEGEKNLPFEISKISIVSSVEGIDNEDAENKWNLSVNQNNDIYLYIDKNSLYKNTAVLEKITLENFSVKEKAPIGIKELYKADSNAENVIFKNSDENKVEKLEYICDEKTDIKQSKISNQGGILVFRYSNKNVGQYISNEDDEINHNELLKKINVNQEELSFSINFDILMTLQGGTSYRANLNIDLPLDNITNLGMQSKEITDLGELVFKRE